MSKYLFFLGLGLVAGLAIFFALSGGEGRDSGRRSIPEIATPRGQDQARSPGAEPEQEALEPDELLGSQPTAGAATGAGRTELRSSPKSRAGGRVTRTRTLKGALLAGGAPLRGGQLLLYAGDKVIAHGDSNQQGKFELSFDVPAESLVLRINARGYALLERDLGDQHLPGQELLGNLFLQKGSPLTGFVMDQAGEPISGAKVVVSSFAHRSENPNLGDRTQTGRDGRFRLGNAPAGRINIRVSAAGYGLQNLSHFHGQGTQPKITLQPGTSLKVKVTDLQGQPVPGARLSLRSLRGGSAPRQAVSDEAGIAHFENIVKENWSVHSVTRGYKPGVLTNIAPTQTLAELKLVPWPRAKGKVLGPGGASPPEGTEVHAILFTHRGDTTSGLPRGTSPGADGSFELLDLRAANYRVRASAPGLAVTYSAPFEVIEGQDAEVPPFELQRGGRLTLSVHAGGKPAAGVSAEVLRQAPREPSLWMAPRTRVSELAKSDAKGVLQLNGLTPGEVWLILRRDGLVPLQVGPISIRNESTNSLSIPRNMQLAGNISGRLTSSSGASLGLGRVRLDGGSIRTPTQTTDGNGRFRFTNLPAGSYSLLPSGSIDGRMVEAPAREVQVSAGKTTEVKITLESE